MTSPLAATALMAHVRALADTIGPRPTGTPQEARARDYIRQSLMEAGITNIEEQPFATQSTSGYGLIYPLTLALLGNVLGAAGRIGKVAGGLATVYSAYNLWRFMGMHRPPMEPLYPKRQSANLLVRLPPMGSVYQRVVLIGHTDTNKHRLLFASWMKRAILPLATAGVLTTLANGLAQIAQAVGPNPAAESMQKVTLGMTAYNLLLALNDERNGYIDGANDNATAIACLLGLAAHLRQHPLQHTEVWLAFTGAEEVGCIGMHALLDQYGHMLQNAWFLDFEMVGVDNIAYVTHHSAVSYLNGYAPDAESLALAEETARRHPELGVTGCPMMIMEEVGALRGRGFRGLCLVGVGADGWLANWHRYSDNTSNIEPAGIERAARFARAMLQILDSRS